MNTKFAPTSNVKRFTTGVGSVEARGAREACWLAAIGDPGFGKTRTLQWYAAQHNGVYLRAKANWRVNWMLTELAGELVGADVSGSTRHLFVVCLSELARQSRSLIVDEAWNMLGDVQLLETLRDLSDNLENLVKELYRQLDTLGPRGIVAANLFRACKSSERAKVYRGGGYRRMAYDRKQWAMDNLCRALSEHGTGLSIAWGWGEDEKQPVHRHVLYIELPTGQVSFHSGTRGAGPDHSKPWDGVQHVSPDRICRWVASLLERHRPSEAAQIRSTVDAV